MTTTYTETLFANTYKDDYADSDNYHRILFNSGRALQARELTQMQTIIQSEIERFGNNIFKDGAAVNPGGPSINANYEFIKLNTTVNALPASSIVGNEFTGSGTAIKAKVLEVVEAEGSDPATLYVQYTDTSAGTSGSAPIRMAAGDDISDGTNTLTVQTTNTLANPAVGQGVRLSASAGDFYVQGHFVFFGGGSKIISKYSPTYTGTIGFKITQDVVNAGDNAALYDNQGATPNLSAPGADRYRIQLTLIDEADAAASDNFVFFTKIINSQIVDQSKGTDGYNKINDLLALRTKEESGNYIVNQFSLKYDEDSASGDATILKADVSDGIAYVDGYRSEIPAPVTIEVNRAQTTETENNEVVGANYGNYLIVEGADPKGLPDISTFEKWNLRDTASYGGATIGTARIRSIDNYGTDYKYHLFDIQMNAGQSFRNVKSIGADSDNFANPILESGKAVLKETNKNNLLFSLPANRPSSLADISLEVQEYRTATTDGSGNATITLSATGETFANTGDWLVSVDSSGAFITPGISGSGTQSSTISGAPHNSAIQLLTKVNKASGAVRSKTLTETTFTGTVDSDGSGLEIMSLAKADIYEVTRITSIDSDGADLSSLFTIDNGQRDNFYAPGKLVVKGNQTPPTGNVFVRFKYFTHGASGDFFAVNSYTGQVDYSDIPSHTLVDGSTVELRNVLDFRPRQDDTGANFSGGTARVNELPSSTDLITSDVTYYLGRKDKLVLYPPAQERLRAEVAIIEGKPSTEPQYPSTPNGALNLYRIEMSPFTIHDSDLSIQRIDATRYTMADIGKIDRKLSKLEEVTSLSLLEADTNNLTILDSSGNNRLKSGFLVDNFANHVYADTNAIDYRASINLLTKTLHPEIREDNIRLIYDSDASTNTIKKGDNVYINHTETEVIEQDKVSGTQNLNPFNVITYNTEIVLSPASDEWKDREESVPAIDVGGASTATITPKQKYNYDNTTVNWLGMSDGQLEYYFDDAGGIPNWAFDQSVTVSKTDVPANVPSRAVVPNESIPSVVKERTINKTIVPFMRSRKIYFKTTGLIPNATYFAFFDGISVASWVREETFSFLADDVDDYGDQYANATAHPEGATALIADASGTIEGSFFIPNTPAIRFRTGSREFALLDISVYDKNSAISIATSIYTSAGAIPSGETINTKSQLKTIGYYDPIAQSILVNEDKGFFITKVRIYFASKDSTLPVKVTLRPMVNGRPSSYDIIPGSIVYKNSAQINIVSTQTAAGVLASGTDFEFDEPIYLQPQTEYAICVSAESSDYSVYVSQIGKFELGSTEKRITQQPSLGSLFLSQNGSTWEPIQEKDLTFKAYRANFDTAGGTVVLENAALPTDQLTLNPFSVDSGDATVTVYHPGHGHDSAEDVTIAGLEAATTYGGILGSSLNGSRNVIAHDYDFYQFEADSAATSSADVGSTIVTATKNIQFDIATPIIETIEPVGTSLTIEGKFTSGTSQAGSETKYQKDTSFIPLSLKDTKFFKAPRLIANAANETAELGSGVKSTTIQLPMTTTSAFVSPVVDMSRASLATVSHRIDKQASSITSGFNVPLNYADETNSENGSHLSKHITTPIVLNEDAVGLKVLISANRPSVADFLVYYKVAGDGDVLKDQAWTLVDKENEIASDDNPKIFREYTYLVGGDGGDLDAFSEFQLKIVMRSTNSSKVPTIGNLRAIAMAV